MKRIILISLLAWQMVIAQTPPERTWYYNKEGIKTTVKERWHENSQGLKNGVYIRYFEDGEREMFGNYLNGKRHGQWEVTLYTDILIGAVKSISHINYSNDLMHGATKTIVDNVVIIQGTYTQGVKTGYWKEDYSFEEKVYSEGNYVDDKRNGDWKNTYARNKSKDELSFGILSGNGSSTYTETRKGYRTLYKNGEVVDVFNSNGENIKSLENFSKEIETSFTSCVGIDDYKAFIKKYPNTKEATKAKEVVIGLEEVQKEHSYVDPLIAKWKEMSFYEKSSSYFNGYLERYPDGLRKSEIEKLLSDYNYIKEAKKDFDNCKDAFCFYLYTKSPFHVEAKEKVKASMNLVKVNNDGSKCSGSLQFGYSVALELKEKFGFNIFRYLNYYNKFENSFIFIEDYPKLERYGFDYYESEKLYNQRKFNYTTSKGKLKGIEYVAGNQVITFEFDDNGLIKSLEDESNGKTKYFKFKDGKLLKANCEHNKDLF